MVFFFKQKTAYEMRISDWSSDVCSSDLLKELRSEHNHRKDDVAAWDVGLRGGGVEPSRPTNTPRVPQACPANGSGPPLHCTSMWTQMTQNLFDWLLLASIGGAPAWAWLLFLAIVLGLLALALGVLHRGDRAMSMRDSLRASLVYIVAALLFGPWLWHEFGSDAGLRFLTGYVIEKSLSLDNIFVISLIFG